jgi:hypothetical protein
LFWGLLFLQKWNEPFLSEVLIFRQDLCDSSRPHDVHALTVHEGVAFIEPLSVQGKGGCETFVGLGNNTNAGRPQQSVNRVGRLPAPEVSTFGEHGEVFGQHGIRRNDQTVFPKLALFFGKSVEGVLSICQGNPITGVCKYGYHFFSAP